MEIVNTAPIIQFIFLLLLAFIRILVILLVRMIIVDKIAVRISLLDFQWHGNIDALIFRAVVIRLLGVIGWLDREGWQHEKSIK